MFGTKKKFFYFPVGKRGGGGEFPSLPTNPTPSPPSATYDGVLTNSCVLVISQQASNDINS